MLARSSRTQPVGATAARRRSVRLSSLPGAGRVAPSWRWRFVAAACGLAGDALAGDPPDAWHPVAWFGSAAGRLEGRWYADSRWRGGLHAAAAVGLAGAAGSLVPLPVVTAVAVGGRGLATAAGSVHRALVAGDLPLARTRLPALVGRDPSQLDAEGVARAVVESVAENTVDAVVAPLLWAVVGGGRGVAAHRAVNTLDAMVGHRSPRYQRFGWASARLDDAAAWLPARLTALAVALLRPRRAPDIFRAVRSQAPAHPSPNSGVAEAAFAAALGISLGGVNRYAEGVEDRGVLGFGPPADVGDIPRAVRLLREVSALCGGACLVAAMVGLRRGTRRAGPRLGRTG